MSEKNDYINKELLDEFNLTPEEFLILVTIYYGIPYKTVLNRLIKSKLVKLDGFTPKIINKDIIDLVENKFDRKKVGLYDRKSLMDLAKDLRSVYPSGNKMKGVSWKGSDFEIFIRLKKLQELTGTTIDHDTAIEATKQYVELFSNDSTFMQTLKYYIFKNELKDGHYEFKSELLANMDTIASGGTVEKKDTDWISELR